MNKPRCKIWRLLTYAIQKHSQGDKHATKFGGKY